MSRRRHPEADDGDRLGGTLPSPLCLHPDLSLFLRPVLTVAFVFRVTTRRGGVTSRMSIPSPTRSTRTATTTLAPSCLWRVGRSVPACTATTLGCGASLPFLFPPIFVHLLPPSSQCLGNTTVLWISFPSSSDHHRYTSTWTQEHSEPRLVSFECRVFVPAALIFLCFFLFLRLWLLFLYENVQIY